jgi:hypothetical protein
MSRAAAIQALFEQLADDAVREVMATQGDDLLSWLRLQYPHVRELPDGSIAAVYPLLTTTSLITGLTRWGYERRHCYRTHAEALRALNALGGEDDEPLPGWIARRPK